MLLDAQLNRMKHRWESGGVEPFDFATIRPGGKPYYVADSETSLEPIKFDVIEFLKGIERIAGEVKASGKSPVMFYLDSLGMLGQEE